MIYYFLPDSGIHGGVKVACQFTEMLNRIGIPSVIVMAGGLSPEWFVHTAPVIGEDEAFARMRMSDVAMITWPPDHERLKGRTERMVCHCQGTSDTMASIFSDTDVRLLTCWDQATQYCRDHFGRESVQVGISISESFFAGTQRKYDNRIAYMPRRGFKLVRASMRRCRHMDFLAIDGMTEREVVDVLRSSGMYLATAEQEQFGLPALEAMAAGCCVVSVPVRGGMEYLEDGENCFMANVSDVSEVLARVTSEDVRQQRDRIRHRAIATAFRYTPVQQLKNLRCLKDAGQLEFLL